VGISIYYTAYRNEPLSPEESASIQNIVTRYSVDNEIAERERTGEGFRWESFCVYDPDDPTEPGIIFEGATKLPDNSEDAIWEGLQHWCRLLTEVRRALPGTKWRVHVDDHDIPWDEETKAFDPWV